MLCGGSRGSTVSEPMQYVDVTLYNVDGQRVTSVVLTEARHTESEPEICVFTMEKIDDNSLVNSVCGMDIVSVLTGLPSLSVCELSCKHRFNALSLFYHWMQMKMRCPVCKVGFDEVLGGGVSFKDEEWAWIAETLIATNERACMLERMREDELHVHEFVMSELLESLDREFHHRFVSTIRGPAHMIEHDEAEAVGYEAGENMLLSDYVDVNSGIQDPGFGTSLSLRHMVEQNVNIVVYLYHTGDQVSNLWDRIEGYSLPMRRNTSIQIGEAGDFVVPFSDMRFLSTVIANMKPQFIRLSAFVFTFLYDIRELASTQRIPVCDIMSSSSGYVVYTGPGSTTPLFTIQPVCAMEDVSSHNSLHHSRIEGLSGICFHMSV